MNTQARRQRAPYKSVPHLALAQNDDDVVTARFKRSTMEAFPCDAREAYAIERAPRVRWFDRLCWIAAVALLAWMYFAGLRWQG